MPNMDKVIELMPIYEYNTSLSFDSSQPVANRTQKGTRNGQAKLRALERLARCL